MRALLQFLFGYQLNLLDLMSTSERLRTQLNGASIADMPRVNGGSKAIELQKLVQSFVRQFGLLSTDTTPCGRSISISYAHALLQLKDWAGKDVFPVQKDLGVALGIDKSNVARLCQRMERDGNLVQEKSSRDRRAVVIRLTPKGLRFATDVATASHLRFRRILSAIPTDAHEGLLSGLQHLNAAVGLRRL